MPQKIRELKKDLLKAGSTLIKGGKGSHQKFVHGQVNRFVLLSGKESDDAKPYQEKQVANAICESKK